MIHTPGEPRSLKVLSLSAQRSGPQSAVSSLKMQGGAWPCPAAASHAEPCLKHTVSLVRAGSLEVGRERLVVHSPGGQPTGLPGLGEASCGRNHLWDRCVTVTSLGP